ncbi:GntR family transcriptional regulator [Actinokineospora soli]|uniref:GntR family transcriptional regulator n=1 Tax=Actinokineospora soli TaxID=1048753 RepID=A0ABW2U084_9PSEU
MARNLADLVRVPERASAAEATAGALRELIMTGELRPGARVNEADFIGVLDVSRNTLREAFRLLHHEKLLVHKLNRGVFVRSLTSADVVDLYRVRRVIECAAVGQASPEGVELMAAAVQAGRQAHDERRWADVGTANIRFHQAVVAQAGSERLDELMRQIAAELRLGFLEMTNPREFHRTYLDRNGEIVAALIERDITEAERLLRAYLDDAEQEMLVAFRGMGR